MRHYFDSCLFSETCSSTSPQFWEHGSWRDHLYIQESGPHCTLFVPLCSAAASSSVSRFQLKQYRRSMRAQIVSSCYHFYSCLNDCLGKRLFWRRGLWNWGGIWWVLCARLRPRRLFPESCYSQSLLKTASSASLTDSLTLFPGWTYWNS